MFCVERVFGAAAEGRTGRPVFTAVCLAGLRGSRQRAHLEARFCHSSSPKTRRLDSIFHCIWTVQQTFYVVYVFPSLVLSELNIDSHTLAHL